MKNNKIIFNLYCSSTINEKQHYLVLIDFLVQELRKYTEVEVLGEELIKLNKKELQATLFDSLLHMYTQRAELEELTIEEFFNRYPVESLNIHDLEDFKDYLRKIKEVKQSE